MSTIYKFSNRWHIGSICILVVLLLSVTLTVYAQDDTQMFVIGELTNIGPTTATTNGIVYSRQASMRAALAEMGYVEGVNVTYIFDPEGWRVENREAAAQAVVAENPDLIIAYGTAVAQIARKATAGTSIPVVFVGSADPVESGIVTSLQNTEGNMTGVGASSEAWGKQLEWLLLIDPTIERVYIPQLAQPTQPTLNAAALASITEFADNSGVELVIEVLPSDEEEDIEAAVTALPDADVDAIMTIVGGPPSTRFIEMSFELGLPLIVSFPNIMDLGPLLSYNYTEDGVGEQAARYVDLILRGADPSNLPVELAPSSLAINLKTAEAIGLEIPDEILLQADIIVRPEN